MKLFNVGSLNLDHVYTVDAFVQPGQTISANDYQQFVGGKGLNQSIALARAGAEVVHVGMLGPEANDLLKALEKEGVNTTQINTCEQATGHAIIQVNQVGENSIIVYPGANHLLNPYHIDQALSDSQEGDWILCQNETSQVGYLLEIAKQKKLFTVFNPAPMTADVQGYPLNHVDLLIVNESEGQALSGKTDVELILATLLKRYPSTKMVLTLGAKGAIYIDQSTRCTVSAQPVTAVDTTAAGDTFIGYFLAELIQGADPKQCLTIATRAAGLCVQKMGAADSIPDRLLVN